MKATQGVSNPRDISKLRKLYEELDSHFKALSVLGVSGEHYSVVVVPELKCKIPRDIAVNIHRSKDVNHEWKIGEFLDQLWQELVIRAGVQMSYMISQPLKGKGKVGCYQLAVQHVFTI